MSELAKAYVQIIPSAEGISAGLEEALGGEMDKGGKKSGAKWVSSAAGAVAKGAVALTAAAGAAVAAMTKRSVAAYAEYEQLKGGVETLFSNLDGSVSASETVLQNASNAYMTAGMSANQYMETVTGYAAALTSSLGGNYEEAARVADMAIQDMADNANKMGTDMESVQNAYNGFAKQNYTMLDNLKLGYGGTKKEMERLLADAEAFSGVHYDIDNLNDVYEAIHVVQSELGITGTTAEEAAKTISGSTNMMKSAWANLLTGIADGDANVTVLTRNLVLSMKTVFKNIAPVITQSLEGITEAIETFMPLLANELPRMFTTLAPALAGAINGLAAGIGAMLPVFIDTILTLLPMLVDAGLQLVSALGSAVVGAIPQLMSAASEIVVQLVSYITNNTDQIITGALQLIMALADGLLQNVPALVGAAFDLVVGLIGGLLMNLPAIGQAANDLMNELFLAFGMAVYTIGEKGYEMITEFITQFKGSSLYEAGAQVISDLWDGIKGIWDSIVSWMKEQWQSFLAIFDFGGIKEKIQGGWDTVKGGVSGAVGTVKDWGSNAWNTVTGWIPGHADGLDYVPYDNYLARLHQGERVLTAAENRDYSNGGAGAQINIYAQQLSQSDIDYVVEVANRRLGAAVL